MKYRKFSERMLQLLLAWQQQNGGQADRQQLVTALYSAHLNDLADQLVPPLSAHVITLLL